MGPVGQPILAQPAFSRRLDTLESVSAGRIACPTAQSKNIHEKFGTPCHFFHVKAARHLICVVIVPVVTFENRISGLCRFPVINRE
jgi:hypothetical protein